jgi:hypothetical protein
MTDHASGASPIYPSTGAPPFDWRQFASRMASTGTTGGSTGGQRNPAGDLSAPNPPDKSTQPANGAVPAEIGADPVSPGEQVDWEDLVGHTPGQKVKTGLAAAAVLFVLYQLSRRIA